MIFRKQTIPFQLGDNIREVRCDKRAPSALSMGAHLPRPLPHARGQACRGLLRSLQLSSRHSFSILQLQPQTCMRTSLFTLTTPKPFTIWILHRFFSLISLCYDQKKKLFYDILHCFSRYDAAYRIKDENSKSPLCCQ